MRNRVLAVWLMLAGVICLPHSAFAQQNNSIQIFPSSTSDGVEDVSDNRYFAKLRQLIGFAKTNIYISVSAIATSSDKNDPVSILLEDLINAAKRGVGVRLFITTYSAAGFDHSLFLREDLLENLRSQKIEVHFVNPSQNLQDQLVVIDEELVLEGGLPWTREDLTEGLGSATLSHSRALAQKKRMRLELLPLWDVEVKKADRTEGRIGVPIFMLQEINFFPAMVSHDDGDAMKIWFALLRAFYQFQSTQLELSYEELGREIPGDKIYERGALNFQVLKTLKRLEEEYGLIKINQEQPDRIKLTLALPASLEPSVAVPLLFFQESYAKELSPRAIFAYLVILYRSQLSGESPVWLGSPRNVEQDFPMQAENFRQGVDELRRQNLIEIYPFDMRQGAGYEGPHIRERRYLINPIATLSEKLATWSRLRDLFGEDALRKAREMADLLGEPEDPKVVSVYSELGKKYGLEDIQSLTRHIAELPEKSTPEMLEYLKTLLDHETNRSFHLAT